MRKKKIIFIIIIFSVIAVFILNGCFPDKTKSETDRLKERIEELEEKLTEQTEKEAEKEISQNNDEDETSENTSNEEPTREDIENEEGSEEPDKEEVVEDITAEEIQEITEEEAIQQKFFSVLVGNVSKFETIAYKHDLSRVYLEPENYSSIVLAVVSGMYYDDYMTKLYDYVRKGGKAVYYYSHRSNNDLLNSLFGVSVCKKEFITDAAIIMDGKIFAPFTKGLTVGVDEPAVFYAYIENTSGDFQWSNALTSWETGESRMVSIMKDIGDGTIIFSPLPVNNYNKTNPLTYEIIKDCCIDSFDNKEYADRLIKWALE